MKENICEEDNFCGIGCSPAISNSSLFYDNPSDSFCVLDLFRTSNNLKAALQLSVASNKVFTPFFNYITVELY